MKRVYALAPGEDWICDRFVKEWNDDNVDITAPTLDDADIIWLNAEWCWKRLPFGCLCTKKVVTTIHHIVPEKFGPRERFDFQLRDDITTAYHVYNQRTHDFIRPLTRKPIHLLHYWANQAIWHKTGTLEEFRKKHRLSSGAYLIGSFQRDTEGHDLKTPKLEKGPDLFVDAVINFVRQGKNYFSSIEVVLAGWRRQYVMKRFDDAKIKYHYFELPSQKVINELYQTLDLYPVTSRIEGGPQSLIECGLLGIPVVSRPVGIAEQVLPAVSIADDVSMAVPNVPNVETWKLPGGYEPYRRLFETL